MLFSAWPWVRRSDGGGDTAAWAFAIGDDRIVAVPLRGGRGRRRPDRVLRCDLEPPPPPTADDDYGWPALDAALAGLVDASNATATEAEATKAAEVAQVAELPEVPASGGRDAYVALLRPLTQVKKLRLPPVRPIERRALLRRNATRFFALARDPVVADVRGGRGRRRSVVGACASVALVQRVTERIEAAGFRVREIAPAPVAVVEAVRAFVPASQRGRTAVLAHSTGGAELLLLDRGRPRAFCPLGGRTPAAIAGEVNGLLRDLERDGPVDRLVPLADRDTGVGLRDAVLEAFGERAVTVATPNGPLAGLDADAFAALGAYRMPERGPTLLTDRAYARRTRRVRRRTAALFAAAAVVLAIAASVHLWGIEREIDAVQARRTALADGVEDALAARRALNGVTDRLDAVARIERSARQWTGLVAALAAALPDSAHLRSLVMEDSLLRVRGVADDVAATVRALDASPAFRSPRLASPVERAVRDGRDRFELTVRVAGRDVGGDVAGSQPPLAAAGGGEP